MHESCDPLVTAEAVFLPNHDEVGVVQAGAIKEACLKRARYQLSGQELGQGSPKA